MKLINRINLLLLTTACTSELAYVYSLTLLAGRKVNLLKKVLLVALREHVGVEELDHFVEPEGLLDDQVVALFQQVEDPLDLTIVVSQFFIQHVRLVLHLLISRVPAPA